MHCKDLNVNNTIKIRDTCGYVTCHRMRTTSLSMKAKQSCTEGRFDYEQEKTSVYQKNTKIHGTTYMTAKG